MQMILKFATLITILILSSCGGGGGGSGGGSASRQVASINITPSSASIGAGQTRTLTAEAKDQNGVAMTGINFTWASSDTSVATVADGVATGVASGITAITASSGGVSSNSATLTLIAILIDKPSVFFSASGQSAQLTAQVVAPQGAASPGAVTWISTAPDKVSVDAAGRLVANAIGSAQIIAEVDGVRSAPTLVPVALPQPGALLVTDAQVVSVGPPLRLAPGASPGIGTEYEVTLQGVAAPAPGTVVLAAETAPVAGKVVATRQDAGGLVVTLALAPLYELFSAYDIDWTIDLSAFPLEAVPNQTGLTVQSAVWNREPPGSLRVLATAKPLDAFKPFQAFECDATIKPQLVEARINLSPQIDLKLVVADRPGYSKHALEGSASLTGSAGIKLQAGFKASGRCDAQAQIKLPILGWLSALVMPAPKFGFGAELSGELLVVQGELGVKGKVGFSPVVGWECGGATPACRGLDDITSVNEFETKSKVPSENDMQVKVDGHFFILAGLDVALFGGAINAGILEARVGPKQSFDLGFEADQAARTDYAASYDLKIEGVVEPGPALQEAIKLATNDDTTAVAYKAQFSTDVSESPKGRLSVSQPKVRPGDAVDFTVEFAPDSSVAYYLLGYNVVGVELYRKREDELEFTKWKFMQLIASNRATYHWEPAAADAGKYEFAAFVETQIPFVLLEVAPNSIQKVEVSCFAKSPLSPNIASRRRSKEATASGKEIAPQAVTACADTWVGTASVVARAPPLPPDFNITMTSNITWTYDRTEGGTIFYTASGGSFTLAHNLGVFDDGCTYALSPNTFPIVNDGVTDFFHGGVRGFLRIDPIIGSRPASYIFGASQLVSYTETVSCPSEADRVNVVNNDVVNVSGLGPFTDQNRLSGTIGDAQLTSTWDFSRP